MHKQGGTHNSWQQTRLKDLLADRGTEQQYDVLSRADRILRTGRHYEGALSVHQIDYLIEKSRYPDRKSV